MRTIAPFVFLVSHLSKVVTSNQDLTDTPCRARAWVRAPDLELGQVVQGHVKVKLDGACDSVSSYSLGLRFAERSWVKTPREGATLPLSPFAGVLEAWRSHKTNGSEDGIYDTNQIDWHSWRNPEVNGSAWDQYQSDIKNPDLWLVREEERIAFETRYSLVGTNPDQSHDIIQPFALLVPSTAYPPAFDMLASSSSPSDKNAAGSEHIYKYFVDVTFSNGTHREVEAGYTSFNAATGHVTEAFSGSGEGRTSLKAGRESVNVTATSIPGKPSCSGCVLDSNDTVPRDTFTLEITFPDGRRFEQGSIHNITIISHQLGPGLQRPLSISFAFTSVEQRHHWAAKHAADNESASELLTCGDRYSYELQPTADTKYYRRDRLNEWESLPQFSQDGVVQNGTVFSTKPVAMQFQVPHRIYPPFDMYYQTSEVKLQIHMQVRNVSDEGITSDLLDDDEYDWVPAMRQDNYRGTENLRVAIPIAVHRKPEHHAKPVSHMVHYLSPEARAPFFVDLSSLAQLLQMTVEERNSLAPFAKGKFFSKVDEDVAKQRYYGSYMQQMKNRYVGNTWLRKVVVPGKDTYTTDEGGALVIQS